MKKIVLSPSIMCADLVNLERDIKILEKADLDALHIDIIDGNFSPSMPLGLETVKRMREITDMDFDLHIMAMDNEFFINAILEIGVQSVTFHYETSRHISRYIQMIRNAGTKVGIALNPATSLTVLEYILSEVDMVTLMLINPGFATNKNETQVEYACKKVSKLKKLIEEGKYKAEIQVDGRVSLESIPSLVKAGADNLVLGSTSLFIKGNTISENKRLVLKSIEKGLE